MSTHNTDFASRGMTNAYLAPGLDVRVGIPVPSGKLAFHAFQSGYKTMVSAQAFWNTKAGQFRMPTASDLFETDFALDSAGYTAMVLFQTRGRQPGMGGIFPWTYSQYLELAALLRPNWYSAPDLCCEPQIAKSQADIDYRIDATATLLEGSLRVLYSWANELARTCSEEVVQSMIRPPVPVVQGWCAADYQRSLNLTLEVWERWRPWLAAPTLIGVGSVCRREINHPQHGLLSVLAALDARQPSGSRYHFFGVKGRALDQIKMIGSVASCDSMAYDFAARRKALVSGQPNSHANRTGEMTRWMSSALKRAAPAPGDQFRLF